MMILVVVGSWPLPAQSQENREYLIKAGFLYNFTKFVDWPAGSFKNDSRPLCPAHLRKRSFQVGHRSHQG